jgi:hypothetical protein
MKITHRFPLGRPIRLTDHWPITLLAGEFSLDESDGLVTGFIITFRNQPTSAAPLVEKGDGIVKLNITERDDHGVISSTIVRRAMSYIQCLFDVEIDLEAGETKYEAERPEEEEEIAVKAVGIGGEQRPLSLSYDFITRALIASERGVGDPDFVSRLTAFARRELIQKRYIDSFRYSFLLFEALYGGGQFKSGALKQALAKATEFVGAVQHVLSEGPSDHFVGAAEKAVLAGHPTPASLISEFVDKRGHYFHGNVKKAVPWHPDKQAEAEGVASVALSVAHKIALLSAEPLWDPYVVEQHQQRAFSAGAKYMLEVSFTYRNQDEPFDRQGKFNMNYPATKATPALAMQAIQDFLSTFQHDAPLGAVRTVSARCPDGKILFEITVNL